MSEEQNSSLPAEQGSGSLATTGGGALLHFSPEKIKVIKNTVAKGATDDELEMFLHLAERYQLDPFAKEIWFVKRPKKVKDAAGNWDYKRLPNGEIDYEGVDPVIMTSRDGYVKVAQSDAEFEGLNSFEVRANDTFHFNPMTGDIKHEIGSKRGPITGAWAICKRKGREPAIAVVDFDEYKKAAGKNPVWDSYPSAMIRKVAEVIVLKRQFNISGLVTQEEMPAQYNLEYADPNIKRLDPKHTHKQTAIDVDDEWKKLSSEVKELRDKLGLEKEQMESIALFELEIDSDPKKWSLSDIQKMVDYLKNKEAQYKSKSAESEEGASSN